MTGSSDDLGGDRTDPLDPVDALLRPPIDFLPMPPGSFERIRRRAARRRRTRAATGGGVALAALAGVLYLGGVFTPAAPARVVTPPVASSQFSGVPSAPGSVATTPPSAVPSGSPGGTSGPGTATASVPSTPHSSGGAGPLVPPTPTTATSTPMCATSQLTASLGGGDAGAGNVYRYLLLTNHSPTPCHVTGFPGLSMLDANGKQIGDPATHEPLGYSPVVLRPGSSVSGTIHTANRQTGSSTECLPTSVKLRIYPPGNKDPLVFAGQVTDCDQLFSVTPFTTGESGNPPS